MCLERTTRGDARRCAPGAPQPDYDPKRTRGRAGGRACLRGRASTWVISISLRRGGATAPWILLGALLGPVGIYLIVKVMHHQCDACKKPVLRGVRQCPGCGDDIARLEHNPVGPMWTYRRDW